MSKTVYIIEDEQDISNLVALHLNNSGFITREFENFSKFSRELKVKIPDLLILDLMLPDKDGLDICKELKKKEETSSIPIIMLTAKGEEIDKILGLELGADDYVTKPFSPKELVARVKAVLRRATLKNTTQKNKITIGENIIIDQNRYEVTVDNKKIELTTTEFKILFLFASQPGIVFNREKILEYLWGNEKIVLDRTIDVHIKHLREKLGKYHSIIKNIRGVGYKCEI